jgi:transposase
MRRYSKLPSLDLPARIAQKTAPVARQPAARPRRVSHRLGAEAIEQLVTDYLAGATTRDLAARYELSKTTVTRLLRQRGAVRTRGLTTEQITLGLELYALGYSVARAAEALDVHVNTLYGALTRAGVEMRGRYERQAP